MALVQGCATYNFAQNVKMVSFEDDIRKGTSIGSIRGEDCTWVILGVKLGGDPTIEKAFINAQNGAGALESAGFGGLTKDKNNRDAIRYVNNVATEKTGFNAGLFAKNCIAVTGVGYR